MARIKIDEMVGHLEKEFRKALTSTLYKEFGELEFNAKDVYQTFKKELTEQCNSWENLPNKFVKN